MDENKKIKLIVLGPRGRVGKVLVDMILDDPDFELVGAVGRRGSDVIGHDVGDVIISGRHIGVKIVDELEEIIDKGDVIIDFTGPEGTIEHVKVASKHGTPYVIGVSGLTQSQLDYIKELAKSFPAVLMLNGSLGMNVLFAILPKIVNILKDYDIEITEYHHRRKIDSPSGTAMRLAEVMAKARGYNIEKDLIFGRKGHVGVRPKDQIGIHAIRGGNIAGVHTIIIAGKTEWLEIRHEAVGVETFAAGSLTAAKWVYDKPPGFYTMEEVLGLDKL